MCLICLRLHNFRPPGGGNTGGTSVEPLDPEWPEVLFEENYGADEGFVKSKKAEPDDQVRNVIRFLLSEGREMGW